MVGRQTLRSVCSDESIFALGDCAHCLDPATGKPLPATAQVAQQQAKLLARSLAGVLDGRPPLAFRYRDRGMLVSLGKGFAVGSVVSAVGPGARRFYVAGAGAKVLYISLYRMHQAGLHGWPRAILLMLSDWLRRASSRPRSSSGAERPRAERCALRRRAELPPRLGDGALAAGGVALACPASGPG